MKDFLCSNRRILKYSPQLLGSLDLRSFWLLWTNLYNISEGYDEVLLKVVENRGLILPGFTLIIFLHHASSLRAVFMFTFLDHLRYMEGHLGAEAILIGARTAKIILALVQKLPNIHWGVSFLKVRNALFGSILFKNLFFGFIDWVLYENFSFGANHFCFIIIKSMIMNHL